MQFTSFARTLLVLVPLAVAACSATSPPESTSASAATPATDIAPAAMRDEVLATSARKVLGNPTLPDAERTHGSCAELGCHNTTTERVTGWNDSYGKFMVAARKAMTAEEKNSVIASLKLSGDAFDQRFQKDRVGLLTAGITPGATANAARHPRTFAQQSAIDDLFGGQPSLLAEFERDIGDHESYFAGALKLTADQYETLLEWFARGMPGADTL